MAAVEHKTANAMLPNMKNHVRVAPAATEAVTPKTIIACKRVAT